MLNNEQELLLPKVPVEGQKDELDQFRSKEILQQLLPQNLKYSISSKNYQEALVSKRRKTSGT